ncbi:SRPBCC family protein [Amycolatopsis sp. WQ 127309]|uniref:SRPBCC family protein n=1 Tax=unclassified Amycolatopsis TaxID=2618356 RepID=UPI001FF3DD23|nr:SRPBCC family protein [Amycolatopsis sp. WQ 127309]UOZ07312.1 SRPBCC family protein [Amycolatopsis sp. WQ 127309]
MEWTGARYADKPTAEVSTWIDAAPEAVWPVVSDIGLMPSLSSELQSVEWCDGETRRKFVGRSKHDAFGEWETTSYVVECEAPRVFAWAVQDPAEPSSVWKFTLEPDNGGTRLSQWMQLGPGRSGLSFAIDRMPEKEQKIVFVRLREFETAMTGNLAAIKDRVEGS